MAEITASQVKALREQSGAGMMECKKALQDAEGDMQKAAALLRERGAAKAVKRADRATNQGLIRAMVSDDKRTGAMVEVNSETDFVARNERFVQLAETVCRTALGCQCDCLGTLLKTPPAGGGAESVQALVTETVGVVGENMGVARCVCLRVPDGKAGLVHAYIHPPGKVGVLVELGCDSPAVAKSPVADDLAHDLCLHIAFSNPAGLDRDSIPAKLIEAEREVFRKQAIQEGKPEKILDKIVEGRLQGFFKERCLLHQGFVKEEKTSIQALVAERAKAAGGKIEIRRFVRYQLGEGLED